MKRSIHWPGFFFSFLTGGLLLLCFFPASVLGQKERKLVREGNKLYENKEYDKAIDAYNEGLQLNDQSYEAAFNLADALYQKGQFEEAANQFNTLARSEADKERLGDLFHNIGNTFLEQQKYQEAVDAFKQGLRNDPKDEDTRYNLAYAQQKLIQQQQQQQQNQDQDKDQDKDQQEGDENQENQQEQGQGDQEKEDGQEQESQEGDNEQEQQEKEQKPDGGNESDQQGDKQGKQPSNPDQLSKEDAERMLEALQNQEQDLQDKMDKKKRKTVNILIEKDW